jgi:hypothetical protein
VKFFADGRLAAYCILDPGHEQDHKGGGREWKKASSCSTPPIAAAELQAAADDIVFGLKGCSDAGLISAVIARLRIAFNKAKADEISEEELQALAEKILEAHNDDIEGTGPVLLLEHIVDLLRAAFNKGERRD